MWPERILGPLPNDKEARAFGVCGIAIALIACGLSLYYGFKDRPFLGRPLGGDFVQFYAAGRILNQHEPTRLFDPPYFSAVQHEILPTMPATQWLIFGNPPCIAALFRPLALLSYKQAYCLWLVFSAALYLDGILIVAPGNRTALLLALSTPMFTLETWIGGQVSVFGFFIFAVFVRCLEAERYFLAGLALGLTAYKPSLLVILAAMFLAGRYWRVLAGIAISAGLVVASCFAAAGIDGMRLWLNTLRVFRFMATSDQSILRRSKYVDLGSFFAILGAPKALAWILIAAALLVLAWAWFKGGRNLLPATIGATLILNVYVPVYDTIILIPALVMVSRTQNIRAWVLMFCLVPWLTQASADFLRVQLLTILIAAFVVTHRDYGRPERSLQ